MGVFIKIDNELVSIAGTVANQQMLDEGYFEYEGEIPAGSYLKYTDGQIIEDTETQQKLEQEKINKENKQFLDSTDWKVTRHRDQLDLGIETSLTNEEFQELLQQRQTARDNVIEEDK